MAASVAISMLMGLDRVKSEAISWLRHGIGASLNGSGQSRMAVCIRQMWRMWRRAALRSPARTLRMWLNCSSLLKDVVQARQEPRPYAGPRDGPNENALHRFRLLKNKARRFSLAESRRQDGRHGRAGRLVPLPHPAYLAKISSYCYGGPAQGQSYIPVTPSSQAGPLLEPFNDILVGITPEINR